MLERNFEICRRYYGKEKKKAPELARLYGVTRERIWMVLSRREFWEQQVASKKVAKSGK